MFPCRSSLASRFWRIAGLLLLLTPGSVAGQEQGYQRRACGFDMNRNGVVGETADCQICDGSTTDPDGDGVDEDLLYIDASAGSDTGGNGSPQQPYRTIQHAWNVADGPSDGAEDILCFRGIATTEQFISPKAGGVAGTYTVARSGSQARDWRFPRNPTMLVGWDTDNDGAYPPFDSDDLAVLDGTGDGQAAGLARTFRLTAKVDYLEIAHLEIRNYGRYTPGKESGFVIHGPRGDGTDYVYYHDLELYGINQDRLKDSALKIAINLFNSGLHWVNFTNLLVEDDGGWFARGSGPDSGPDEGPIRWQNITRRNHGCDFPICGTEAGLPAFKIWGYMSGFEILDSIWDANVADWQPNPDGGHGARWLVIAQCSQDWTIRNNQILDASVVMDLQPASGGFCAGANARPIDHVVFDRNIARNTYPQWGFGNAGIQFLANDGAAGEGNAAGETAGSVTITNNFLSTSGVPWESCIWVLADNEVAAPPGQIVVANNTCVGDIRRWGAISIGRVDTEADATFRQQNLLIQNNIVLGTGRHTVEASYAPSNLEMDFNVFDPDGTFQWIDGVKTDLAGWQQKSGGDAASVACQPSFSDASTGDFHLQRNDACARSRAQDLSLQVGPDIDGEERPSGRGWDIGADQQGKIFADGFETGDLSGWPVSEEHVSLVIVEDP